MKVPPDKATMSIPLEVFRSADRNEDCETFPPGCPDGESVEELGWHPIDTNKIRQRENRLGIKACLPIYLARMYQSDSLLLAPSRVIWKKVAALGSDNSIVPVSLADTAMMSQSRA